MSQSVSDKDNGSTRLPAKLKKVRQRKKAARLYQCDIVMNKLRLVQIKGKDDR